MRKLDAKWLLFDTNVFAVKYRLFNELNSSIFNMIGRDEPAQTKALGYLLARSPKAMKGFLDLLYDPKEVKNLLSCNWVIDCEYRKNKNQVSSQRVDILIRFFKKHTPEHAVLIEAKGIGVSVNGNKAALQASNYLNTFPSLSLFQDKTDIVTLTKLKSLSQDTSSNYTKMLLWQDLQEKYLILAMKKANYAVENELINDFLSFLNKLSNAMRFYDKEVLVIPANSSYKYIQQYHFYECVAGNKQYDARANSHPLYVAFRAKGVVSELFKICEIVRADLTDSSAVDYLIKKYPYLDAGLQKYVFQMKQSYNKKVQSKKRNLAAPSDDRWVFVLENNLITLPQPVALAPCRNHTFTTIQALLNPRVE